MNKRRAASSVKLRFVSRFYPEIGGNIVPSDRKKLSLSSSVQQCNLHSTAAAQRAEHGRAEVDDSSNEWRFVMLLENMKKKVDICHVPHRATSKSMKHDNFFFPIINFSRSASFTRDLI